MITKEQAYKTLKKLIVRFDDHIDTYKKGYYNETQTRIDYINPFFKALGWDIDNEQGLAEAYREVIHEDKIKIGGTTKAPDYCFTVYGQRKFFVDAKKPSVNIKSDISPAYQVRRYGWSAKLPIAIVTDFEEFSIYDCSKKPNQNDRPSVARIQYLKYNDYLKEFDFIWETFSKERILKGSFDKFVQSDTKKRGTATVDKEFLKEIEEWRKYLATTIALRNKELTEDEVNFSVQKNIDRILFLRICEDRGVEQYASLKNAIKKGDFYKNLFELFHIADEKYNSGLFDFKEDTITPNLNIDNKVIKNIVQELYYPLSPFEFSVLPADILGSVYEQFLGKTIRLTKAHHARIEEKPEVRKAGGVYYTPKYIVDYIVKNTVGKLINGKTPKQVENIKICDPACGSGSFLIGAYQYLLNWHLKYYTDNPPKKKKNNPLTPDGNLTTAEKKRILLNNIYGVDIDPQAVEVTKLNLLLKAMEGETQASISKQLTFFNERVLPNLGDNIKCGNSLIGNDFYDNQLDLFPEQMKKINAFDWENGFPEIFNQGGFNAVIGNPPYVMLQTLETRESFDYALKKYESAIYKIDTYQLFIELSVEILNDNGLLGFITPNTFLKNIHSEPLRNFLLQNTVLKEFMLFQYPVFSDASVDVCISVIQKNKNASKENELAITNVESPFDPQLLRAIKQSTFLKNNRLVFNISISDSDSNIINKIKSKSNPLSTYCKAYFGIQTYDRKKYVSEKKLNRHYEPIVDGGNIHRFYLKEHTEYVSFVPEAIKSGGNESVYRQTRIGIRQIGHVPIATIIPANIFGLNTLYNVYKKKEPDCHINFLLAFVNSKPNQFIWKKTHYDEKKTFPKIKKEAILSINIYNIDFSNPEEKKTYDSIVKFVDNLLKLNKQLQNTKLETQRKQLQRAIDHSERKIDELVYGLYGLTNEEIKIIESES